MTIEVEIGGNTYRTGKIDAFVQFNIAKRLLPMITAIGPDGLNAAMQAGRRAALKTDDESASDQDFDFGDIMLPLTTAIATITDEDSRYVFVECMKVTQRKTGESWVSVWNRAAGESQFDDIGMMEMCQIAFHVMADNISNFLRGLPAPPVGI